ncbi:interferon-induced GTP-binding protein Mx3-like [Megalops cyprinoides]|uniref:interferon-induced GTP-binding protein Mx3-like n=1 Tax=Megalops cyprinoides TaxID=118141 RepID=UPI0018655D1C|nr:interferon-induced GTP-binding protein Mx3-like [Megalops cyprinoides]
MDSPTEESEDTFSFSQSKPVEGVFYSHLEEKVRPYIDLIDTLRGIGIERDVDLPAIAVVGDQSSGKSSVLEALSGVALPRGTGIVTRCPLELKLRRLRGGLPWRGVISYKDERIPFREPSEVTQHVEKAQEKLAGTGEGICNEIISLEISSPDVCDLTLIDLPGIARVAIKNQPEDIGEQIRSLIQTFIEKAETIILVVVPCNTDIATTEALKMAQEVDPEGIRTLAVLTKPDLIDRGTEKNILDIVRNKVVPLSKGYILVKCRGQKQIDEKVSLIDATKTEREFFSNHAEFRSLLSDERATTQRLAAVLTQNLVDHIKTSLPVISEQIRKQLGDFKKELIQYEEGPPLDPQRQKTFLINILTNFNDKINKLTSGEAINQENLFLLLRPEFQKWKKCLYDSKDGFQKTVQEVVDEYDSNHRGRELPCFSQYHVFESVVKRQVKELKEPAMDTVKSIQEIVKKQFAYLAETCFRSHSYLKSIALDKIYNIQSNQEAKVQKRILEQFEMEQLVYTQDSIFFKTLFDISEDDEVPRGKLEPFFSRSTYPEMLDAYYKIVVQRLADEVPMLILLFMLKKSGKLLISEMLNLIDGGNVAEILRDDSAASRQRLDLQHRVARLNRAQEKLAEFFY